MFFLADYKAAVPYCKQRCDGIEIVCGSHSYELTRELSKLIQALVERYNDCMHTIWYHIQAHMHTLNRSMEVKY